MKIQRIQNWFCTGTMAALFLLPAGWVRGADEKTPDESTRQELRQQLKALTPEERRAKLKELRAKHPEARPLANFARLTPAERAARLKEVGIDVERMKNLPPAERRKELRDRAEKRLAELQKKKADGTLTPAEEKQLLRGETLQKRLGRAPAHTDQTGKSTPAPAESAPPEKK